MNNGKKRMFSGLVINGSWYFYLICLSAFIIFLSTAFFWLNESSTNIFPIQYK